MLCRFAFLLLCYLTFLSISLTLSVHAQRGLRYLVVCVCVCVSVCMSVKSHLTSGASVCPENTVAYSAGNGGQKIETQVKEPIC